MGLRVWLSVLVVCALSGVVLPVRAEVERLAWSAPAACPDQRALSAAVERLVSSELLKRTELRADAAVTQEVDGSYRLVLSIQGAESGGTRTLRIESCESALNVAAFSIALAIDPELTQAEAAPTLDSPGHAPEPSQHQKSPVEPRLLSSRIQEQRTTEGVRSAEGTQAAADPRFAFTGPEHWVGAQLVVDTSLLPQPAPGLGVSLDARVFSRLRVGVSGRAFLPGNETSSSGSGGHFSFWSLQGRACYVAGARWNTALCPLLAVGVLAGEGRGVDGRLDQDSVVLAPGLALLGVFRASQQVSLVGGAEALFPVIHDVFVVKDGPLHRIPSASLQFCLGAEMRVD